MGRSQVHVRELERWNRQAGQLAFCNRPGPVFGYLGALQQGARLRRQTMNAATILKAKGRDVVTVRPDMTLEEAAHLLAKRGIGCVVVVERRNVPAGILSERDIVREIALGGVGRLQASVADCMTRTVHSCRLSDTIDQLMAEMTARRIRHIPVLEDGEMIGLVSIGDVVKLRIAEAEMETEAMRAYITAG